MRYEEDIARLFARFIRINLIRSASRSGLDRAVILAGHLTEFTP
jgi:hypothetical protein